MQSHLKPIGRRTATREEIDRWPVAESGLNARVVHCLEGAGVRTIRDLRRWNDENLLALRSFGSISLSNVRWFAGWTTRLESGTGELSDFRSLLQEFLNPQERFVVEQRFGLTDPIFRPQMKRRTLQEIADLRDGITRERVRQVEESAIIALRSRLCLAVAEPQEIRWVNRIQSQGSVVTSAELADCVGDPLLGGYHPWGVLLLFSEVLTRIHWRPDYFTSVPGPVLDRLEQEILQFLRNATEPQPFDKVLAVVGDDLRLLSGQTARLLSVLLDYHPFISGTVDRRYFLPAVGTPAVIQEIMRRQARPLHFQALTQLYNEGMQPHSRTNTRHILRTLRTMGNAQCVARAVYELKEAAL